MPSLIGIEVPAGLLDRIITFGRSIDRPISDVSIMLIGPNSLENVRGIEQKLQSFCLGQPEFKVTVGAPVVYDDRVLYLNVQPGAINIAREKLVAKMNIGPEKIAYRPHVTLIRSTPEYEADFAPLLERARRVFREPYTFTAEAVTLYTQPRPGAGFAPAQTMPLTGR